MRWAVIYIKHLETLPSGTADFGEIYFHFFSGFLQFPPLSLVLPPGRNMLPRAGILSV